MDTRASASLTFREAVTKEDREIVSRITASSGFFSAHEVDVAVDLLDERLAKGVRSGYHFLFALQEEQVAGYSCYGPIPCTVSSYDLFWIVVEGGRRGMNIGTQLLKKSEEAVRALGGTRIYVETSSRPLYEPTRAFYEKRGYIKQVILDDFYDKGDGKVIYVKVL